ncbi:hypothetical protein R3P38DRAFT_3360985 [Favolaschia claudopus]|uniref:Uncharacterized protein n=1 Tax=Favolaschia claudopus TaxID=2862362 RepID=A0AAW0AUU0_9AGAR
MPFQHTAENSSPTSVEAHSHDFLTTDWIKVAQLRQFVENECHHRVSTSYPPKSTPTRVKGKREVLETVSDSEDEGARVKSESTDTGSHSVVDISSDSEEEVVQKNQGICSFAPSTTLIPRLTYTTGEDTRSSSPLPPSSDVSSLSAPSIALPRYPTTYSVPPLPPPIPVVKTATSSNTGEAASKKPVSRKWKVNEVDLANVITTARARKAPKRADPDL